MMLRRFVLGHSIQTQIISLLVTVLLLVSGIAAVQFTQWAAIENANGEGRTTAQWEVFQVSLEHFKLRTQIENSLRDSGDTESMRQLTVRYNIFLSRYDLLNAGQNGPLLQGRPSKQHLDSAIAEFGALADEYLGDGTRLPAYDQQKLTALAQSLDRMSDAVYEVIQDSNQRRAKLNADYFLQARNQTVLAWVSCALLLLIALGFGLTALRQMRLLNVKSRDLEQLHQDVSYRASHDVLTQLVNRREFERLLQEAIETIDPREPAHAVLYIDLDRFKVVNDTCGHAAGDQLLRELAKIMGQPIRASDVLARIGGDEFAVLLRHCGNDTARVVAEQICMLVDQYRLLYNGYNFHVGASIGLVLITPGLCEAGAVMQAADSACYVAKESGRNRVYTYRETDSAVHAQRGNTSWARRLSSALDEQRFELHWQRIVPLQEGGDDGIAGEILVRLREDGQIISASDFLPVAERYALIGRIDRWVLSELLDWLTRNQQIFGRLRSLALNVSGHSIGDPAFREFYLDKIAHAPIPLEKLCIEITETSAIANLKTAVDFLAALRRLGVRVALDDFGSGMSSFVYLKSLPVDYLKIDGQFMRDIQGSVYDRAAVQAICEVARTTGKATVAEGVETEAVAHILKALGVNFGQGHVWHRDEPLDGLKIICAAPHSDSRSRTYSA